MLAILKKEINSYFKSLSGYSFLAMYYLFAGYYFFYNNLYGNSANMNNMFDFLFTVTVFLVPILTMNLLSEEYKNKTYVLLEISRQPKLFIVLAKYFSALFVYACAILITFVMGLVVSLYSGMDWIVFFGNILGLFLLGMTLIAIGIFISSVTESQIIAALGSIIIGFSIVLVGASSSVTKSKLLADILKALDFDGHFTGFKMGLIQIKDLVFFISVAGLFIYVTALVLESKRRL